MAGVHRHNVTIRGREIEEAYRQIETALRSA
jgi:hypothetical protein